MERTRGFGHPEGGFVFISWGERESCFAVTRVGKREETGARSGEARAAACRAIFVHVPREKED